MLESMKKYLDLENKCNWKNLKLPINVYKDLKMNDTNVFL